MRKARNSVVWLPRVTNRPGILRSASLARVFMILNSHLPHSFHVLIAWQQIKSTPGNSTAYSHVFQTAFTVCSPAVVEGRTSVVVDARPSFVFSLLATSKVLANHPINRSSCSSFARLKAAVYVCIDRLICPSLATIQRKKGSVSIRH